MVLTRRKRLPDGSFGPPEKVFDGETSEEKVERLEAENKQLKTDMDNAIMELTMLIAMNGGSNS